jgi:hypothetical protein
MGGNAVNRPRAADDFATIRARMEELRRERDGVNPGLCVSGGRATRSRSAGFIAGSGREALIAVSFWALDPEERRLGLDGSDWLIEGRCKDIYRAVSRWSPRDEVVRNRGNLFFELAGSPLARIEIS